MSKSRQKELGHKHKNNKEGGCQKDLPTERVVAYQRVRKEEDWYPEIRVIIAYRDTGLGIELLTTPIPEPGTIMKREDLRRLGLLDDETTLGKNRRENPRRL
jgi:hypothetical protein